MGEMKNELKKAIKEGIFERRMIAESSHKVLEHFFLWVRNVAAAIAVIFFIISLFPLQHGYWVRGMGYILGAVAYFSELLMMTDCFTKKVHHKELFMVYCFGPLYILLGISYFLGN